MNKSECRIGIGCESRTLPGCCKAEGTSDATVPLRTGRRGKHGSQVRIHRAAGISLGV